jgi:hypothetical protein
MAKIEAKTETQTANSVTEITKPRWISFDEAAKLEKYLNKHYIPKNDEKFAKTYYYKVQSILPYVPADNNASTDETCYKFVLQKYYRNKTERANVATESGGSQEIERNAKVDSHQMINGKWVPVDSKANIPVDFDDFKRNYIPDAAVE